MSTTLLLDQLCELLNWVWKYIKNNSIDFITIVASILIAIQTDKWIEHYKERKQKEYLLKELPIEIEQLLINIESDKAINANKIKQDKLTLRLYPYETPLWNSIKNTERIDLLVNCNGYKEMLQFYDELNQLNVWENLLTVYMLFSGKSTTQNYQELIFYQIVNQRDKCIALAKSAREKLKGGE